MKLESKRFKVIDSKLCPRIQIYDLLLSKVVVDICTGNKQINEFIAFAAFYLIHGCDDLMEIVRELMHDDS